jgi:hypothetical protein
MNEAVKSEWIKRLRSGDYAQTKELLRDDKGYCCLGVLCQIAIENEVIPDWEVTVTPEFNAYSLSTVDPENGSSHFDDSTLPWAVVKWSGLDNINPYIHEPDGYSRPISEPNDNGMPFSEIADMIEEQF